MKILLGFSYYDHPVDRRKVVDAWLGRLRAQGIDVDSFPLTLNPPAPWMHWPEIDRRWRLGDRELLGMYEALAVKLEGYDVLVNYNGISLHPEFVQQLTGVTRVYCCFDDPESSEILSKPVAHAYDFSLVGNVAEVETYKQWGVERAYFWPLGFYAEDYNPALTREQILTGERDVDLTLLCERVSGWRSERLDKLEAAFPDGAYYGHGWRKGFLTEDQRVPLYQRTKIGINMHNSSGPINFRTYTLPANGVMQVCDNKSDLGKIFELGTEVAGFDTVEEGIELIRYYLAHDKERRAIAAAGWERAIREYNEVAVFQRLIRHVEDFRREQLREDGIDSARIVTELHRHRGSTAGARVKDHIVKVGSFARQAVRAVARRIAVKRKR